MNIEPINSMEQQSVQQCGQSTRSESNTITLTAEEDNAIRYVCGYVASTLIKKFKKIKEEPSVQFVECLGSMGSIGDDSSYLKYTSEWLESIDRGGLFHTNDNTFQLFRAIEIKSQDCLQKHLLKPHHQSTKEHLLQTIMRDESIQFFWCMIDVNISDHKNSVQLLREIVETYVTARGFAMSSAW